MVADVGIRGVTNGSLRVEYEANYTLSLNTIKENFLEGQISDGRL